MAAKTNDKPDDDVPKIDLGDYGEKLNKLSDEPQLFSDLENGLNSAYLSKLKYTDDKGVIRYKQKLNQKEAKEMAQEVSNEIFYHGHRRQFGISAEDAKKIGGWKDEFGNHYKDAVLQNFFNFDENKFAKDLTSAARKGTKFTPQFMTRQLQPYIRAHTQRIQNGLIEKLNDPAYSSQLQGAIDAIKKKHKLKPSEFIYDKNDFNDVVGTYVQAAGQYGGK